MTIPPQKKVVIDTNVLVRTTFQKRSPISLRIYHAIAAQECILVTSPEILAEVRDVISRDYIIEYTHMTPEMRGRYINTLIAVSIFTPGTKPLTKTSRDAKDNRFLIAASEVNADYIVTSDRDLLDLEMYEGIKIIPVHEFVALLETGKL
jgi:putative PIN family toxin of toxin-antitoxin system